MQMIKTDREYEDGIVLQEEMPRNTESRIFFDRQYEDSTRMFYNIRNRMALPYTY